MNKKTKRFYGRLNTDSQDCFLEALRTTGNARLAAAIARPRATGPRAGLSTFQQLRSKNEAFRNAWDQALEEHKKNNERRCALLDQYARPYIAPLICESDDSRWFWSIAQCFQKTLVFRRVEGGGCEFIAEIVDFQVVAGSMAQLPQEVARAILETSRSVGRRRWVLRLPPL